MDALEEGGGGVGLVRWRQLSGKDGGIGRVMKRKGGGCMARGCCSNDKHLTGHQQIYYLG